MGGLLLHRLGSAELGLRVDELLRAESASAFLALVTICTFRTALGAGADNVAVCKEGLCLRVIVLLALPGYELALVVELAEEGGGVGLVHLAGGAAVDVEVDAETREGVLDDLVVPVDYVLRSAALLTGLDGDRHSVLIASADIEHVLALHAQVPHIYVSRHIHAGKMAYVHRSVGIRERTCD